MSERKEIKLEEILDDVVKSDNSWAMSKTNVFKAMKEACRQTLELVAENAKAELEYPRYDDETYDCHVNRQSILNTINQIK